MTQLVMKKVLCKHFDSLVFSKQFDTVKNFKWSTEIQYFRIVINENPDIKHNPQFVLTVVAKP